MTVKQMQLYWIYQSVPDLSPAFPKHPRKKTTHSVHDRKYTLKTEYYTISSPFYFQSFTTGTES